MYSRALALVGLLAACGDNGTSLSILVFTRENMWVHDSNPVAAAALEQLAGDRGWTSFVTADPADITEQRLARTDVVVFSVTSGPVLGDDQRAALETFFAGDGGFVGLHSASATEADWPFYRQMVPVTFLTHPYPNNVLSGSIDVLDRADPILAGVPDVWPTVDEFYTFNERPETIDGLHLLYALDESSYAPIPDTVKIGFHPLAFTTERTGNRAFYTALGHDAGEYSRPEFMDSLRRAIEWSGERRYEIRNATE